MNLSLNNIANLLIILLPIFLITGPLLSDLSLIIIDFIFLYYLFKNKDYSYVNNFYFKLLIIFNIYISARSIFAEDILFSIKSSFTYFRFVVFIFALNYFFSKDKKLIDIFSKIFILTLIILCVDALVQYIFGVNTLGFKIQNPDKINGLFGDEAVLGSYLVRFFPLLIALFLFKFELKKNKFIFIGLIFLLSSLIFISGSRSSLLLLILFLLFVFLLLKEIRKELLFTFISSVILISVLIQISPKIKRSFYASLINPIATILSIDNIVYDNPEDVNKLNFKNVIKKIFSDNKKELKKHHFPKTINIFTPVYDAHYRTAYKIFQKNKIFGVGNKMYRKLCSKEEYYINKFSCTTHPHNFYLQVLVENGLVGFVFIMLILCHISFILLKEVYFRNFKNEQKLPNSCILIILGIFINLWPIVPSGNLFNNWLSILLYFPVGFYYYFKEFNERI